MKTIFQNRKAELIEATKRMLSNVELAFVCLALPTLFLIGIKGNEHTHVEDPSVYDHNFQVPQNKVPVVDFRALALKKTVESFINNF